MDEIIDAYKSIINDRLITLGKETEIEGIGISTPDRLIMKTVQAI